MTSKTPGISPLTASSVGGREGREGSMEMVVDNGDGDDIESDGMENEEQHEDDEKFLFGRVSDDD